MTIADMHTWFRQYAQQMGMQNVRAILPEQIDLLINTSITDTINQIIQQNIGVTNDRIITDNSKLGQINALKTLYKVKSLNMFDYVYSAFATTKITAVDEEEVPLPMNDLGTEPFIIAINNGINSYSIYVNIDSSSESSTYDVEHKTITLGTSGASGLETRIIRLNTVYQRYFNEAKLIDSKTPEIHFEYYSYSGRFSTVGVKLSGKFAGILAIYSTQVDTPVNYLNGVDITSSLLQFNLLSDNVSKNLLVSYGLGIDWLYLVDFSIDYKKAATGMHIGANPAGYKFQGFVTKYFPVRLIDDAYLADVLNDYILAPRFRTPVITINNSEIELYFDDIIKIGDNNYTLAYDLVPYTLRVSYIEKPARVVYRSDAGGTNVDCNLPEYLHVDILKHAVDLYRASINGGMLAQQGQDQNQQREIARNTAVPSNGYNQ